MTDTFDYSAASSPRWSEVLPHLWFTPVERRRGNLQKVLAPSGTTPLSCGGVRTFRSTPHGGK